MITQEDFGTTQSGSNVQKFIFSNNNGYSIHLLSYGLSIQKIIYPDNQDIALGFDTISEYETDPYYIGKIIGRNANRLSNGSILINQKEIQLSQNENNKQLHGGHHGFDTKNWNCEIINFEDKDVLIATYTSKDLEEGYPGELKVTVSFELTNKNTLEMSYTATTSKTTVVNLTRHDYFNLKDGGISDIKDHLIKINADQYTVNNTENLPTGEIKTTKDTALHFNTATKINENIAKDPDNLIMGYDHNYIIKKNNNNEVSLAGTAIDPNSKRQLEVYSSQPGLQFYTAAYLNQVKGKNNIIYNGFHGFCFEGQHFPDATKHKHFDSTILRPQQTYTQKLIYKFSTK
ncbi:aldose epimerase family protein [Aquimarina agarilytica]|uniref:aldose epimerase family protein n=1 Tax=Aquimarina agarilytica TaxID=1087449 RepID=UPI00028983B8|nr:aldose epimerase family protein [Aquimarina agarilytica]